MATTAIQPPVCILEATEKEAHAAFDYTCRYYMQMSAEEFLARLDANKLDKDSPQVQAVLTMLPFVR